MVLPFVSVATAVVIIAAVVAATRGQFLSAGLTVFAVVALQNAFGMGLGFLAGRLFGMDVAKCKALCFEVGMQNSALGVMLATVHFAALPSAVGALWHNVSGAVVASFFQKLRGNGEKKTFFEVLEENAAAKKHAANASHKAAA